VTSNQAGRYEDDPLYDDAVKIVREKGWPSISLVQRHLKIGYNRAARLLEEMERKGVVSPMAVDGTRKVLIDLQAELRKLDDARVERSPWIAVADRLPDTPGFYIVWVNDPIGGHADAQHYHPLRELGGWKRHYVTHWQPMLAGPSNGAPSEERHPIESKEAQPLSLGTDPGNGVEGRSGRGGGKPPIPHSSAPEVHRDLLAKVQREAYALEAMPGEDDQRTAAVLREVETFITGQPAPTKLVGAPGGARQHVAWLRYNDHNGRRATTVHLCDSDAPGAFKVYREQPKPDVAAMVDRFLAWPLPKDFGPDAGISFTPSPHPHGWPTGTNLLTAEQARAMFAYALESASAMDVQVKP